MFRAVGRWLRDRIFDAAGHLGALAAVTIGGIHFDHPWLIAGVLLGPIVHGLRWHARRQKRRVLESFATASARPALLVSPPRHPILQAFLADVAWLLTLLASAGPRWGFEEEVELVRGRDIVLVLDMSQSMRATDAPPTRFDRAREAAVDLVDDLRSRPGFRVAVVAFAAEAALVCPLTEDMDYLRFRLESLSLDDPPWGIRPRANARSGTSFAAALRGLLSAHDPQARGFQDAILLSDGDDPGGLAGFLDALAEVEQAGVAVYTLGVGDPESGTSIRVAGRDEPVQTRLNEYPLEEIARRTAGVYFPTRLSKPDVRGIFRRHIESKERTILPGRVPPQPKSQAGWLYGLALVVLGVSAALAIRWQQIVADLAEGLKRLRSWTHRLKLQNLVRLGCWLLIALALLTAAEPRLSDDWERQADQAMLEGRFAEAAELYRRAAERTVHP
ncbi:MAG: VWA domain-containing protein, partial [Gemmataceae bacterium]|nr:VWA domain-containing protein [Gemmataceae bacterium]